MNFRMLAVAAVLGAVPAAGQAGPRDAVVDKLVTCTDVTDDLARLACYDKHADELKAAAQAPVAVPPPPVPPPMADAAPSPAPAAPPAAAAPPESDFSFLGALDSIGRGPPPPSAAQMAFQPIGQEILPVTIGVTELGVAPGTGEFTVTLDNGQVWRKYGHYSDMPRFHLDQKSVVRIEHRLLGGYMLFVVGSSGGPYAVERIK